MMAIQNLTAETFEATIWREVASVDPREGDTSHA